jgi:hypothetical protein
MGRTRDVSKILTSNTSILSLASASSIYQTIAKTGLVEITPPTITATGGSGSISATGVVSFTSASAISLNDVFSSTYTNYRIVINVQSATSQVEFLYRMRVSGTDTTSIDYYSQLLTANGASATAERVSQATGGTLAQITNNQSGVDTVFYRPFETVRTMVTSTSANSIDTIRFRSVGSVLADSVSYTGLTFYSSQNITGTISVYGYNK